MHSWSGIEDCSSNLVLARGLLSIQPDVPTMKTYFVEIPQGPGPFGAIGMGEAAHFPMAPAIMAAINDACGIWIDTLPAKPEKILTALQEKH